MLTLPHAQDTKQVLETLKSSENGLTQEEVIRRRKHHGLNELKEKQRTSPWKIFFLQFNSLVMWILIAVTIISILLGDTTEAIVIIIVLLLISIVGFYQEYKAERAIEALQKLASYDAKVIRNGQQQKVAAKYLVPGDIILLETGYKVPADARILSSHNLKIQEAALTGESNSVKKERANCKADVPLAERVCMVYSGTIVTSGKATCIVTETGMLTEIGKIADMIQEQEVEPTPLQKRMDELGRKLGYLTLLVTGIVFIVGILRSPDALSAIVSGNIVGFLISVEDIFKKAVALAVAAIPEGLPAVVTISLALGTRRMLQRHALVRRLPSVETLGSTTVICTDKTGTLTMNEMTVKKLFVNDKVIDVTGSGYNTSGNFFYKEKQVDPADFTLLLEIGALNNDADITGEHIVGDPTEAALLVSAEKAGITKERINRYNPRVDEVEFDSGRKRMTTIHTCEGEKRSYVKGAPEIVLSLCTSILIDGKVRKITQADKERILLKNKAFGEQSLRVLGFAYKTLLSGEPEKSMTFVGMQGMMDPPRQEVKHAIKKCHDAGIKVVMITGDQEITAQAVAAELGLKGKSMHGSEIDNVDLDACVNDIAIFSRVNPEHKLKIVAALQKKGHIVAMTGDGVNDAPALKKSDIGVAMGNAGTDVSKEASDMILTDDNFSSIVNAVEEGRGTYDNIKKYFGFLISGNIGEVFIIFLAALVGLPDPLTAIQILLINLVTDTLPALALAADPFEPHAMKRKPRKRGEPIYSGLKPYILYYPVVMVTACLAVFCYFYFHEHNLVKAQTATFVTIAFFELYQAFACRSTMYSMFKVGLFKNPYLLAAVGGSIGIVCGILYVPALSEAMGMFPLAIGELLALLGLSSIGAITIELTKKVKT